MYTLNINDGKLKQINGITNPKTIFKMQHIFKEREYFGICMHPTAH